MDRLGHDDRGDRPGEGGDHRARRPRGDRRDRRRPRHRPPPGATDRRAPDGGRPGAAPRAGPRRDRRGAPAAGADAGRAARTAPGRERRPSPMRCSTRWKRPASRPWTPPRGGPAMRRPTWPGRLELLSLAGGRDVLLDGAHNPAGAAALAQALDDLRPFLAGGPLTLRRRDDGRQGRRRRHRGAAGSATALRWRPDRRHGRGRAPSHGRRATGARWRAPRDRPGGSPGSWRSSDPIAALDHALGPAGPVVVAGSLYLVGAVRAPARRRSGAARPGPRARERAARHAARRP